MAARVIPFEENASALNITITANDVSPEGWILQAGQTSVTFYNNSGSPVSIAFNPTGIFTNINNLPNGQTSAPQPAPTAASVNYNVTIGAVVLGPFAIQGGPGPMYVQVSGPSGSVSCVPLKAAIPVGGTLEMRPALSTDVYDVAWTNGDPFTVPLNSADSTPHTNSPNSGPGEYPYTATKVSISVGGGGGGGRVIVRNV